MADPVLTDLRQRRRHGAADLVDAAGQSRVRLQRPGGRDAVRTGRRAHHGSTRADQPRARAAHRPADHDHRPVPAGARPRRRRHRGRLRLMRADVPALHAGPAGVTDPVDARRGRHPAHQRQAHRDQELQHRRRRAGGRRRCGDRHPGGQRRPDQPPAAPRGVPRGGSLLRAGLPGLRDLGVARGAFPHPRPADPAGHPAGRLLLRAVRLAGLPRCRGREGNAAVDTAASRRTSRHPAGRHPFGHARHRERPSSRGALRGRRSGSDPLRHAPGRRRPDGRRPPPPQAQPDRGRCPIRASGAARDRRPAPGRPAGPLVGRAGQGPGALHAGRRPAGTRSAGRCLLRRVRAVAAHRGHDPPGPPRPADQPAQPRPAARPGRARAPALAAPRHQGLPALRRPRRVQARQRPLRARGGRRRPHRLRAAAHLLRAHQRHGVPARWRRVRDPARGRPTHRGRLSLRADPGGPLLGRPRGRPPSRAERERRCRLRRAGRHLREPAPQRRPRDVRSQVAGQEPVRHLRGRAGQDPAPAPGAGGVPAGLGRRRRAQPGLPTRRPGLHRPDHGCRGARPLELQRGRHPARRVHQGGRGERADRAARRRDPGPRGRAMPRP